MARKSVTVVLGSFVDQADLSMVEEQIAEARKRAASEDIADLQVDIVVDRGYYGDIDGVTCNIIGSRPETDEEVRLRERQEQARSRYTEQQEREQYERLRKKFEKD